MFKLLLLFFILSFNLFNINISIAKNIFEFKHLIYLDNNQLYTKTANTPQLRSQGLMNVKNLPKNSGMLFIFENSDIHCFWMKNTVIPLSIAFLDDNKTIIDILDMQPLDETPVCPSKVAKYAIEVNQGWFKHNLIMPNLKVKF